MNDQPTISPDDVQDVIELSEKLENYIYNILKGRRVDLGFSAIMNATVNSIFSQCNTLNEIMIFREVMIKMMDASIKNIHIKNSNDKN